MSDAEDRVVIGIVASPHGVRGTVRVKEVGSGRHLREGIAPIVGGQRRRILLARRTGKGFLLDLEGVGSRPAAAEIGGMELTLGRGELDEPEEGEFYVRDLIGLRATLPGGDALGFVEDVLENSGNEVLVIRGADETAVYVPFTAEHVPIVDVAGGAVVVEPPRE